MKHLKLPRKRIRNWLSFPFIWFMIFPLIILDITIEIYHHICFSLYGLKLVNRGQHIKIDRFKLKYLNLLQKVNCMFCGYANGLLAYSVSIAAETEKYWCGIKHQNDKDFKEPKHHKDFLRHGDQRSFKKIKK